MFKKYFANNLLPEPPLWHEIQSELLTRFRNKLVKKNTTSRSLEPSSTTCSGRQQLSHHVKSSPTASSHTASHRAENTHMVFSLYKVTNPNTFRESTLMERERVCVCGCRALLFIPQRLNRCWEGDGLHVLPNPSFKHRASIVASTTARHAHASTHQNHLYLLPTVGTEQIGIHKSQQKWDGHICNLFKKYIVSGSALKWSHFRLQR